LVGFFLVELMRYEELWYNYYSIRISISFEAVITCTLTISIALQIKFMLSMNLYWIFKKVVIKMRTVNFLDLVCLVMVGALLGVPVN
jgi:hypothetical protein